MQEIVQKISELFLKYGIKSVSMDDLARELGMSKKTLYQYFDDKKDVVDKVMKYIISSHQCGIEKALNEPNLNAIDKLMMMTRIFADHLRSSNPSLTYDLQKYYSDIYEEVLAFKREEVFNHIMDNVRIGIGQGLYLEDINYEIIARTYVSRMEMYHTDLWQPLEQFSLSEVFSTLFIYHIRGIASKKGIAYLESNSSQWKLSSAQDLIV